MRWTGVLVLVVVSAVALAAVEPVGQPVVIPRAEQIDVKSKAGREYRLFVQGPATESAAPDGGYPVYYFTDANAQFGTVASLARIQQPTIGPVILVGIGYPTEDRTEVSTRRSYDLTPVADPEAMKRFQDARKADPNRKRPNAPQTAPGAELKYGGQEEFFTFLQDEVKPLIEKKFAVNKEKQVLFGHSFGGLFTLHVMFTHPDAFQTYIAASPSLFVNPAKLAEQEAAFTAKAKDKGTKLRLLVTLGELEAAIAREAEKTTADPRAALLKRLKDAGVDTAFKQFEGENHGSVVPFAHMRGLRFAFEPSKPAAP